MTTWNCGPSCGANRAQKPIWSPSGGLSASQEGEEIFQLNPAFTVNWIVKDVDRD